MKDEYEPESEISKLCTLAVIMLVLGAIQLGLFHFAYEIFGVAGAAVAFGLLIVGWSWLFDYAPGIDYYQKQSRKHYDFR